MDNRPTDTMTPLQRWETGRTEFGLMLKNWRHQNNWPMRTASDWASECPEILPVKVLDSTWTGLEAGRNMRTSPQTFLALGLLNQALAQRDRGAIKTRALRDLVDHAVPICHADGKPWDYLDFFAAFMGDLPIPQRYLRRPMTRDDAGHKSEELRLAFRRESLRRGMRPIEAFGDLEARSTGLTREQFARFQEVLLGFADYEPEELEAMNAAGVLLPECVLKDWAQGA